MDVKEKWLSLGLILFLFAVGINLGKFQDNKYSFPNVLKPLKHLSTDLSEETIEVQDDFKSNFHNVSGKTNYSEKKIMVDANFTTDLPLVVIDTHGQKPKWGSVWSAERGHFVSTGEDPYVSSEITLFNNKDGLNKPTDSIANNYTAKIKIRGNSSGEYDKKQYLIKFANEKGKLESHDVFNMGKASEWVLNISFFDKSLLRNYLAYTTASEIMPYTPDVQYCEVLWKDGEQYFYEGVYLMMESISVSKYRVDLPKYSENSDKTPALIRRDRYNSNGIMLDNYGTLNQLTPEFLDVEYPDKKDITQKGIDNITEQIDRFEESLYADEWEEFIKYRDYIDVESFVDYFLINEFFMNYDAGYHSTYCYMTYSGKISMGPVWDFDQAIDNNRNTVADLDTTAFHAAPWFDKMLQDPVFTTTLIERYKELRKSILSNDSIKSFVEDTIVYLGPAIDRDWARWGYYYKNTNFIESDDSRSIRRNTYTHEEEVERIYDTLFKHAEWMDENLDSLYQFKMIPLEDALVKDAEKEKDYRSLMATGFVIVFMISINLILRYESE